MPHGWSEGSYEFKNTNAFEQIISTSRHRSSTEVWDNLGIINVWWRTMAEKSGFCWPLSQIDDDNNKKKKLETELSHSSNIPSLYWGHWTERIPIQPLKTTSTKRWGEELPSWIPFHPTPRNDCIPLGWSPAFVGPPGRFLSTWWPRGVSSMESFQKTTLMGCPEIRDPLTSWGW